jgi:hypothetical protein
MRRALGGATPTCAPQAAGALPLLCCGVCERERRERERELEGGERERGERGERRRKQRGNEMLKERGRRKHANKKQSARAIDAHVAVKS